MVFGSKVVLPTKQQYRSPRVQAYQMVEAEQARQDVIDLLEESRDTIIAMSAGYQRTLRWYHA
jgi:hypothetical protein